LGCKSKCDASQGSRPGDNDVKNLHSIPQRLADVRKLMRARGIDGLFVPRTDEFQGEYVPASAERLLWATGFSGSWGMALIGLKRTALVVDGRYTVQAAKETRGMSIELLPPDNARLATFLSGIKRGATLAFDPWVTSIAEVRRLRTLVEAAGLKLVPSKANLIDQAWQDRPAPPHVPICTHSVSMSGLATDKKLLLISETLRSKGCDCVVLTDPHSVAWALNIRGSDVSHTPIALLRALVFKNGIARLFIDKARCPRAVLNAFGKTVTLADPNMLEQALTQLSVKKHKVLVDANFCPEAIRVILDKAKVQIVEDQDPCVLPRACKNKTEQNGARRAHIRDGAALANYLAWLERTALEGTLSEIVAQDKLEEFRRATGKLEDLSFGSISAAGPNAALPHYHAVGKTGRTLQRNEIYLIDSGGQYRDGTTDVTRTVIIGEATPEMKRHNTLVLKGMIAVSLARFPVGTTGIQLDAMARSALWHHGFDFDHGTGHGVGSYLSVHEGPARISKAGHVALQPGMILSNEPGYYRKGKYGIRIENLLLVKAEAKPTGGDRPMLSFETLTFAPIDKHLIEQDLLTKAEIHWLDEYHAEVLGKIGSLVNDDTRPWLEEACAPLTRRP
jgi:Xaa-Pro aminopeptidase